MKSNYHLLNITGILVFGFLFATFNNGGFRVTGFNVISHPGTLAAFIAPAVIVLLIGLIIRIFRRPNWKIIYIIAWILFLIVNLMALYGNHSFNNEIIK
jgi:hypothetical protein